MLKQSSMFADDAANQACQIAQQSGAEIVAQLGPMLGRRDLAKVVTAFRRTRSTAESDVSGNGRETESKSQRPALHSFRIEWRQAQVTSVISLKL